MLDSIGGAGSFWREGDNGDDINYLKLRWCFYSIAATSPGAGQEAERPRCHQCAV